MNYKSWTIFARMLFDVYGSNFRSLICFQILLLLWTGHLLYNNLGWVGQAVEELSWKSCRCPLLIHLKIPRRMGKNFSRLWQSYPVKLFTLFCYHTLWHHLLLWVRILIGFSFKILTNTVVSNMDSYYISSLWTDLAGKDTWYKQESTWRCHQYLTHNPKKNPILNWNSMWLEWAAVSTEYLCFP